MFRTCNCFGPPFNCNGNIFRIFSFNFRINLLRRINIKGPFTSLTESLSKFRLCNLINHLREINCLGKNLRLFINQVLRKFSIIISCKTRLSISNVIHNTCIHQKHAFRIKFIIYHSRHIACEFVQFPRHFYIFASICQFLTHIFHNHFFYSFIKL